MYRHLNLTPDAECKLAKFKNGVQQELLKLASEWKANNNSINPSKMLLTLIFHLSTLPDDTAKEYVLGLRAFDEIQASVIPADLDRVQKKIQEARAQIDETVYDAERNPLRLGTHVMVMVPIPALCW